jgi:hypothetical protein
MSLSAERLPARVRIGTSCAPRRSSYEADGMSNAEIARRLDQPHQAVSEWRKRFCQEGIQGLRNDRGPAGRGVFVGLLTFPWVM